MERNPPGSPTLSSKTTGGEGTLCPISRVMTRRIRVYIKSTLHNSTRAGGYYFRALLLPAAQPDGYGSETTRRGDEGDDDYDGVRAFYSGTNERAIERDRSTAVVALHFPLQRGKNRRGVGSRRIAVSSASRVRAIARERRKGT